MVCAFLQKLDLKLVPMRFLLWIKYWTIFRAICLICPFRFEPHVLLSQFFHRYIQFCWWAFKITIISRLKIVCFHLCCKLFLYMLKNLVIGWLFKHQLIQSGRKRISAPSIFWFLRFLLHSSLILFFIGPIMITLSSALCYFLLNEWKELSEKNIRK